MQVRAARRGARTATHLTQLSAIPYQVHDVPADGVGGIGTGITCRARAALLSCTPG